MSRQAMGFVETVGFASALLAADTALKAANVTLVRMASVIGVGKCIGVTIYLTGDVGAVNAAVSGAQAALAARHTLVAARVIARLDADTEAKLISTQHRTR